MEPGAASAEEPDGGRYRPADAAARVAEAAATLAFSRFGGRRGRDSSDVGAPSGDVDVDGGDGDLRRRLSEMLSQRESLEAIKGGREGLEGLDGAQAASVVARRDSAVSAASVDDDGMSLDSAELGELDRQGDARLGGGQSQRSLSVSILEDKDCGVHFAGNDAADAGNGTKPDPLRAPERGSTPAAGGWGYESSIGSVTSLFRGSLVRVMGRKRGDSTSSAATAAPSRPAPLPYRPRRRGATVRRRRDSSPEEGDHIASSLLMMRSWGGKASPPTAWDGARVRREGPRHVSWNIHDNYRHESDARRVAVTAARPRRLRATGGGEARVSWDLDDYNRSPRRERLSSLLSDISASIGDAGTRREELVDMLYDELGGAASTPPTPPFGELNRRRYACGDGHSERPPVLPFGAGRKPLTSSFSSAASGGEDGVVDPFWIPPFQGGKRPPPLENDGNGETSANGAPRDAAGQCDSPLSPAEVKGNGGEEAEEAEELVSYSFDHHRSGRPHGLSGLTASAVSRASLLSSIASAEGSFVDDSPTVIDEDDEEDDGEGNLAELHRRLSISSPGGEVAAANFSDEDERQQRLLETMMRMADRRMSGEGLEDGSSGGDDSSEVGMRFPLVGEQKPKVADCDIDGDLPGGADSDGIQSLALLQDGRKKPANGEADQHPEEVDPGTPDGGVGPPGVAALGPPTAAAAPSSPMPAGVPSAGPNGAASLARREVEDYRTRLRRKRDSMASACDREEEDRGGSGEGQGSDGGGGDSPLVSRERLNEMLLENAASISNSLLLQRALLALGRRSDGGAALGRSFAGGGRAAGMLDGGGGEEAETPEQRKARFKRANSHDTGLERLAINHVLTSLSSSRENSGTASTAGLAGSGSAAGWEFPSRSALSSPGNGDGGSMDDTTAPTSLTPSASSPIRQPLRRRVTEADADPSSQRSQSTPQVGAVQCNEPAPLLFTRAFSASSTGRGRERRAEARRHSLAVLEAERSGGTQPEVPDEGRRSADGGVTVEEGSSEFRDGGCGSTGELSSSCRLNDSFSRRLLSLESIREDRPGLGASEAAPTARGGGETSDDERESSLHNSSWHGPALPSSTATLRRRLSARILESTQDTIGLARRRTSSSADSGTVPSLGGRAAIMRASVRPRSVRDLLEAVLVSDEVVHADHVETSFHGEGDVEEMQLPSTRERLAMMEDLIEEQEEERDLIIDKFERRERVLKIILGTAVLVIIALIVLVAVK